MTLPVFSIRADKPVSYLLDLTSPDGGPKARFFIGRGFPADDFFVLMEALARHGSGHWPGRTVTSPHGVKHVVVGPMPCPDGSTPDIRSVWMLSPDGTTAKLVTAYPAKRARALDEGADRALGASRPGAIASYAPDMPPASPWTADDVGRRLIEAFRLLPDRPVMSSARGFRVDGVEVEASACRVALPTSR